MTTVLLSVASLLALFAYAVLSPRPTARLTGRTHTTPLDEAERILARRYARGEITYEEYGHMVSVLRR